MTGPTVTMETMHFHIAQISVLGFFFRKVGESHEQYGTHEKLP